MSVKVTCREFCFCGRWTMVVSRIFLNFISESEPTFYEKSFSELIEITSPSWGSWAQTPSIQSTDNILNFLQINFAFTDLEHFYMPVYWVWNWVVKVCESGDHIIFLKKWISDVCCSPVFFIALTKAYFKELKLLKITKKYLVIFSNSNSLK